MTGHTFIRKPYSADTCEICALPQADCAGIGGGSYPKPPEPGAFVMVEPRGVFVPVTAPPSMSATEILDAASQHMRDRASQRDQPGGERSMPRVIAAFNALTGHNLSERDGNLFMVVLKAARATTTATGVPDDYQDGAAYFAMAGECASK